MEKIMLKTENKIFKNLYNEHGWEIENAVKRYKSEVIKKRFPTRKHSFNT